MKKTIRIAVIGLGQRGNGLMNNIIHFEDVAVIALCDRFEERIESMKARLKEAGRPEPFASKDYRDILALKPDLILLSTSWCTHVEVTLSAMELGIPVAMEVGGTHHIDDCWKLVDAYEKTHTPFFFLENCCYNREELLVTSLVRNGVFGEVIHCSGAYRHDLRGEIAGGIDTHHYRLEEYKNNNCENYPTHELGPIAKILNINRGNRFTKLVSMSSKARGMNVYIDEQEKYRDRLGGTHFAQGDVTNTLIQCENGETISLTLDTTLPHLYDRALMVEGTKGWYSQTIETVVVDGKLDDEEFIQEGKRFHNQEEYADYLPEDWKNITEAQRAAGHGGMDYVMLKHLFDDIREGREMAIDIYDAVSWMVVTALSALSIEQGSVPVDFPDFTRGKYKDRKPIDVMELPTIETK